MERAFGLGQKRERLVSGRVEIFGLVQGIVWSEGTVFVAQSGVVMGGVKGRAVVTAGKVTGRMHADAGIWIAPTGWVDGPIETLFLTIDRGAVVRGPMAAGDAMERASRTGEPVPDEAAPFFRSESLRAA